MKLPRWLVVSLLTANALGVIGYGGWWWVTWPEHTGREFATFITARKTAELCRMLRSNEVADRLDTVTRDSRFTDLEFGSRSLIDLLTGHQEFQLAGTRRVPAIRGSSFEAMSPEVIEKYFTMRTAVRFTAERGGVLQSVGVVYDDLILMLDDGEKHHTSPDQLSRFVKTESCQKPGP